MPPPEPGQHLVHVVDDEDAVRAAVAFLLDAEGYRVAAWPDGVAFLDQRPAPGPGEVILLDVRMPRRNGLEVQQALLQQDDATPVIILTGHADIGMAVRAMKAGAADFLEKPFEAPVLLQAIEDALHRFGGLEAQRRQGIDAERRVASLSDRERAVLKGLAQGLSNKAIARRLGISPRTVEVHRAAVMSKLQATGVSQLLRIAFLAGIDAELV